MRPLGHEAIRPWPYDVFMTTTEEAIKQLTLRMPAELHMRLKIVAAKEGKTIQEILNGLTEAWVSKKEGS